MPTLARTLLFGSLTWLAFALFGLRATEAPVAGAVPPPGHRVVYLARGLSDEAVVTLGAAVGTRDDAVLLLDSKKGSPYLKAFLAAYRPEQVVPVGSFPEGIPDLERRLDVLVAPAVAWTRGPPLELWRSLSPHADAAVVCPAEPRGQLLQAACLAGLLHAPLYVTHDEKGETIRLRKLLTRWHARTVYLIGTDRRRARALPAVEVVRLADEGSVAAAYRRRLARQGRISTLVVANPYDNADKLGGTAALAPWVALQKRAALLLTNKTGTNADAVVERALGRESLRRADALILVANLQAIPMEQRPNPIPTDKDPQIEMEPLTPAGSRPFTFATGRLFHEDPAVVPLLLARQRLLDAGRGSRKAAVASNPGSSLPLLETFSRNTAQELRNAGYETTAVFGKDVNGERLRKLLTSLDVFLWEGHHNTLIREYEFPAWDEPMGPALVFLQSCLALKEEKVQLLLSRGAIGVIGSSTRTYSGSGGACSLAFFDALLYEGQTLGGSLRQAKNFLLAYSLLKQKRLGKGATRTGANLRAAWAFTLWGDPTVKLPRPSAPASAVPPVQHVVTGNTIVLALPDEKHERVKSEKFAARIPANGRMAGLVKKEKPEEGKPLVPFVFAEVSLPKARPGRTPRLHSRLPSRNWVFCWDERRRCGYLLVTPRDKDHTEIRFHVEWQSAEVANTAPAAVGQ